LRVNYIEEPFGLSCPHRYFECPVLHPSDQPIGHSNLTLPDFSGHSQKSQMLIGLKQCH